MAQFNLLFKELSHLKITINRPSITNKLYLAAYHQEDFNMRVLLEDLVLIRKCKRQLRITKINNNSNNSKYREVRLNNSKDNSKDQCLKQWVHSHLSQV